MSLQPRTNGITTYGRHSTANLTDDGDLDKVRGMGNGILIAVGFWAGIGALVLAFHDLSIWL